MVITLIKMKMMTRKKRMMNAKQDQYREYVIEKLLAETTIGIINKVLVDGDEFDLTNKKIIIR